MLLTFKRQVWCEHGLCSYDEQVFQEINRDKLTDGLLLILIGSMEIYSDLVNALCLIGM